MFWLKKAWIRVTKAEQMAAYVRVFGTQDGLKVLHDLALKFHLMSAHDGSAYMEGQRSVLTYMLQNANFTEEDFVIMAQKENEQGG